MKKRIFAALLAVLMLIPAMAGIASADGIEDYTKTRYASEQDKLDTMMLAATSENGNIELYFDTASGEMGVKNKATGEIMLSNPHSVGSKGLKASIAGEYLSQIYLNYTVIATNASNTYYSYNDCALYGQLKVERISDGIRVTYKLGDDRETFLVPFKIAVEDLEELLQQIRDTYIQNANLDAIENEAEREEARQKALKAAESSIKNDILIRYTKFDPYEVEKDADGNPKLVPVFDKNGNPVLAPKKDEDGNVIYDENGNQILEQVYETVLKNNSTKIAEMKKLYPICETIPIYVINDEARTNTGVVEGMAKIFSTYTDYTFEKLEEDTDRVKEAADAGKFAVDKKPLFTVCVDYYVTNDGFVAELDAAALKYDRDLYYVKNIGILPFFGAVDRLSNGKANTGYTFIPDGSGALIRFEDVVNKGIVDNVTGILYGTDYALYQIANKNVEQYTMPVFGLVNSSTGTYNEGHFAIIEDGDALASIVSDHDVNYHAIYPTFTITATDIYDLADAFSSGTSSSTEISVKAEKPYDGMCRVKYAMLSDNPNHTGEKASYLGMAQYYRDYLESKGIIDKLKAEELSDFTRIYLEVFGSIQADDKFLSFPIKVNKELTTFEDVKKIHSQLSNEGIGNMTFLLKGFANGGLQSTYPTSFEWQSVLGGADGYNDLVRYAKTQKDLVIAPEIDFTYSQDLEWFSGFGYDETGVRTLDNRYSTKRLYNAATQTFERTGGVAISSASFGLAYEKLLEDLSEYDVSTLAVRTLGSDLNSDLDKKEYYDREASKENVTGLLTSLKKDYNLIVDAGNAYSVKYADSILGASLDSSRFIKESEAVPFFGIVYHGSVEFAGNPINMDGDSDYMFLKAIENGASLYFTVAMQNTELLKFDKEYNKYYSVQFSILKNEIVSMYNDFNKIMADKQDKYIIKHEFMNTEDGFDVVRTQDGKALNNSNVVLVVYGNEGDTDGEGFILNYNTFNVTVKYEGKTYEVAPFSYEIYPKAEEGGTIGG